MHNLSPSSNDKEIKINHALVRLGYIALIPFGFGVLCVWLSPWILQTGRALIIAQGTLFYAAITASYLAGMGSGNSLSKKQKSIASYLPDMMISAIAWLAIIPQGYFFISIQPAWRAILLVCVFSWLYFRDMTLSGRGVWPKWYGKLRFRLSAWIIISLMAIFARLILWHQY